MENAIDALKIAFAVFVFIVAVTVAFNMISKAKTTGDYILFYSDKTNFYDKKASKEKNREVSKADVISTLYRWANGESLAVTIDLSKCANVPDKEKKRTFNTYESTNESTNFLRDLNDYIKNNLSKIKDNAKFEEEFVEAQFGGKYEYGTDGTELELTSGEKKVYVTYTLLE